MCRMAKASRLERLAREPFLAGVFIVTAAYLAIIWQTPAWLTGTPEYHWPVLHHGEAGRLAAAGLVLFLAGAFSVLFSMQVEGIIRERAGRIRVYIALFLLGVAFQAGPASVHRMGLLELPLRVYLPDHTSYFTDARKIKDPGQWLAIFPSNIRNMATHTRTHPPGAVLCFYGAVRLMERFPGASRWYVRSLPRMEEAARRFGLSPAEAAAGGVCALILFCIAAGVAPLTFAIGRMAAPDRAAAVAAVLFGAMPAFSHKTPTLDHFLAALILFSLWLVVSAVSRRELWRAAPAGVIIGAGSWIGTALLAALPLCALYLGASILYFGKSRSAIKERAVLFISFMVVLAGVAVGVNVLLGALMGVDYIEVYRAITEGWRLNNTLSGRVATWMWIGFNPYELLAWAGVPAAAYFLLAAIRSGKELSPRRPGKVDYWLCALVVFLLLVDLSGKICYEASRLLWFTYPLIALESAKAMPLTERGRGIVATAIVIGLMIASTLVFRMIF